MDDFSKFIKGVRLSYDKESTIRKVADAISQATTLQKVIYINGVCDKLKSECSLLILMKQLNPTIDISGDLRLKQELLNQCEQALNQLVGYSGEAHPVIPVITTQFFQHGLTLCA